MGMTKEEYKRGIINNHYNKFHRILFKLGITRIKVIESKALNQKWKHKVQVLNPWNPLSYIIFIILIVVSFFILIFEDIIPEIKRLFKYD